MKQLILQSLLLSTVSLTSCSQKDEKSSEISEVSSSTEKLFMQEQSVQSNIVAMLGNTNNALYLLALDERVASVSVIGSTQSFGGGETEITKTWQITLSNGLTKQDRNNILMVLDGLSKPYIWMKSHRWMGVHNYNYSFLTKEFPNSIEVRASGEYKQTDG